MNNDKRERGPAADPVRQHRASAIQSLLSERAKDDLRNLLSFPWGRRFYQGLVFGLCQLQEESYAKSAQDMARTEGIRHVGIVLAKNAQESCPDEWAAMLVEHAEERARRRIAERLDAEDNSNPRTNQ